jgi:hypothetical protein
MRIRKTPPVIKEINGTPVTINAIGLKARTVSSFSGQSRTLPTTRVQVNSGTIDEISAVPTPVPTPTGNTNPGTTAVTTPPAPGNLTRQEYEKAVTKLKSINSEIKFVLDTIAREEAQIREPGKFGNLIRSFRLQQIRFYQNNVATLKSKATEAALEVERLQKLL